MSKDYSFHLVCVTTLAGLVLACASSSSAVVQTNTLTVEPSASVVSAASPTPVADPAVAPATRVHAHRQDQIGATNARERKARHANERKVSAPAIPASVS